RPPIGDGSTAQQVRLRQAMAAGFVLLMSGESMPTERIIWRAPLRPSAAARKAPNACVDRGRATHSSNHENLASRPPRPTPCWATLTNLTLARLSGLSSLILAST